MFSLQNKNIIVAGPGLIGSAVAEKCREAGANILTFGLNDQSDIQVDMSTTPLTPTGKLDAFINCTYPPGHEKHYRAFCGSTEAAARHMANHGGGTIILMSSIYGLVGSKPSLYDGIEMNTPSLGYAMVKGAIVNAARWVATNYGRFNVRCHAICPGGVQDGQDPLFIKRYCDRVPLGRMARPEDIAHACVYLCSDEAAYLNGVILPVDGGLVAQ